MITLATQKDISQHKTCAISPISWGTKKIQRIVTSTLPAETSALSTSLDQPTWIRFYWAWLLDPNIPWQKLAKITNLPPAISLPIYKANDQDLAITDRNVFITWPLQLLFPTVKNLEPNCWIRDILAEGIRLHRVHSGAQLADALTKMMEANFPRETLKQ